MKKFKDHLNNPIVRLIYILVGLLFSAGFVWATLNWDVKNNKENIGENEESIETLKLIHTNMSTEITLNQTHRNKSPNIHMPYLEISEKFVPRKELKVQLESIQNNISSLEGKVDKGFEDLKEFIKNNN